MLWSGTFGKHMDLLHRSMDVGVMRRSVIANNIANADTPNFKRTEVSFESELRRALRSENNRSLPLALTETRHIPAHQPADYRTVRPRRVLDYLTTATNNGNNVDAEQEMVALLQNQLQYQTIAQAVAAEYGRVNIVLG